MMLVTFSPIRSDAALALSRRGDVITINGTDYDFTAIHEGATLPRDAVDCEWLASDVERIGGRLTFSLILPHRHDAPDAALHPMPMELTGDGPVAIPGTHANQGMPR